MEIVLKGEPKEIATLVLAVQERRCDASAIYESVKAKMRQATGRGLTVYGKDA